MTMRTKAGPVSFAEFLEIIHEDQKADLIDGVIYMSSPENIEHNDLLVWLAGILDMFVRHLGLGKVTVNRVAYRLTDKRGPEPDIAFVRNDRLGIVRPGFVDGPPDLAIEIISPDSVDRDYEDKRRIYEAAGVKEYWIIDLLEGRALFLILGPSGYVESRTHDPVYRSQVLQGFSLDTRWFWQRPLPDPFPILQSLMADVPH